MIEKNKKSTDDGQRSTEDGNDPNTFFLVDNTSRKEKLCYTKKTREFVTGFL